MSGLGRAWGGLGQAGEIYLIRQPEELRQVGHCWAKGTLNVGDVILCQRHSGDFFYDYILLGLAGIREGLVEPPPSARPFGSYQIGKRLGRIDAAQSEQIAPGAGASACLEILALGATPNAARSNQIARL